MNRPTPSPWTNDSTLPGWFSDYFNPGLPSISPPSTGPNPNIYANSGSPAGTLFCSYGSDADRAIGFETDFNDFSMGVLFQNGLSSAITFGTFSVTGEQWRTGNQYASDVLAFSYRVSSSPILSSSPHDYSGWTAVSELNFYGPNTTQYFVSQDGNAPQNRTLEETDLGLTIQPGEYVMFRWSDGAAGGVYRSSALGVDDLSVSYSVPEPSTATLTLCAASLLIRRKSKSSESV